MSVEENAEKHEQDDERCARNRLDTGFTHHTDGDSAEHERGENENHSEHKGCEGRETTDAEDENHGEERYAHEDGNVFERPFVPAFALHVFLAPVALESRADVREDVGKGPPHFGQTEHTASNDGADGDRPHGLGKGDHLQRRRTTACVVLNGDVGLLRCIVNGHVHEHRKRNEEEPANDGAQIHQESDAGFHEPTDGEHRGRERHADVGVGEGVPSRFFRPVRLLQGNAVNGAGGLVDFSV